jgi:hypothetical protein
MYFFYSNSSSLPTRLLSEVYTVMTTDQSRTRRRTLRTASAGISRRARAERQRRRTDPRLSSRLDGRGCGWPLSDRWGTIVSWRLRFPPRCTWLRDLRRSSVQIIENGTCPGEKLRESDQIQLLVKFQTFAHSAWRKSKPLKNSALNFRTFWITYRFISQ